MKSLVEDSGFTLQELLVAVNVGFLMVSFALLLFLSAYKLLGSWQNRTMVKNQVNSAIHRLALDTERGQYISGYADTLLAIHSSGSSANYHFVKNQIKRNDISLNASGQTQMQGRFSYDQTISGNARVMAIITGSYQGYAYKQEVTAQTNSDSRAMFNKGLNPLTPPSLTKRRGTGG